jgi:hypothetical protein
MEYEEHWRLWRLMVVECCTFLRCVHALEPCLLDVFTLDPEKSHL